MISFLLERIAEAGYFQHPGREVSCQEWSDSAMVEWPCKPQITNHRQLLCLCAWMSLPPASHLVLKVGQFPYTGGWAFFQERPLILCLCMLRLSVGGLSVLGQKHTCRQHAKGAPQGMIMYLHVLLITEVAAVTAQCTQSYTCTPVPAKEYTL